MNLLGVQKSDRRAREQKRHPSLNYVYPYETSQTVFGVDASADFLIQRIRSCSWEASFKTLALLAAKVSHLGQDSEEIRQLTIDPLTRLTGDASTAGIIENARRAVAQRRNTMVIAHEQSLSFLQHLVLLEGGDGPDIPGDPEISMWLTCAGPFLTGWQKDDIPAEDSEELIVTLSHLQRFNNKSDAARNLVRSSLLFGRPPKNGDLSDRATWNAVVAEAFSGTYEEFFEGFLGLLFILSRIWGDGSAKQPLPVINLPAFIEATKLPPEQFTSMLEMISADRETLRAAIKKRLKRGLPHAPTALLYQPFVKLPGDIYVGASPWAIQHQIRFAPWARMLRATKVRSQKKTPDAWFQAFGQQVEGWCRSMATAAQTSSACKAQFQMPENPGGVDEVEDVVLIERGIAVLFSVKSRVMDAKAAREAVSVETTMKWYREFLFELKGDDFRGGAIRQLDARIRLIRNGRFEAQGIRPDARLLPVIVTYDSLGETDSLYRWIEAECVRQNLLQGPGVGPVCLARVDEFEDLMAYAAAGKSVVKLIQKRNGPDRYRRLDQIIYEHRLSARRRRLKLFEGAYQDLRRRLVGRLNAGNQASANPLE